MADNASITILRNTQANINAEPIKDGNILFTTDQAINAIYTDVGTKRIKIGGTVPIDSTITADSVNPVTSKAIYTEVDDVRGQICTNLLNPTAPTQTIRGVTFTNNGDGTYTVNGTNVSSSTIFLQVVTFTPEKNMKCKFIGTPPTSPFGEEVCLRLNVNSGLLVTDKGSGAVADINAENTYDIFIRVGGGVTVNNFLFKPMLTTDLSATYDSFVKYSGSEERLNEQVASLHESSKGVITNLLNPTAQTQTINGVTFTSNGDGTYTVNGTASEYTFLNLNYVNMSTLSIPIGTYKLTGTPSNKGGVQIRILAQNNVELGNEGGSGSIITIPQNTTASWARIAILKGTTCNNLLFKPMITTDLNATYDDYVPYTGDSGRLNEDVANLFDVFHPIGSLYSTTNTTFNPNTATGWHGTWERIKDCVIYAAGDSDTVGQIVGSNTHTLTEAELPSHRHSIPALNGSTNETGNHTHDTVNQNLLSNDTEGNALQYPSGGSGRISYAGRTTKPAGEHTHTVTTEASNTGYTGSGTAIDMRPRRLNSVVWKRVS